MQTFCIFDKQLQLAFSSVKPSHVLILLRAHSLAASHRQKPCQSPNQKFNLVKQDRVLAYMTLLEAVRRKTKMDVRGGPKSWIYLLD